MANRLGEQLSPYLLQHAENPVNWFPWGDEAFKVAKEQQKPIFLSIGYATCHWCHVMAHESFEDEKIATLMNEVFINVKVDREERPDIDSIYMEICQMITGRGGWPLTVILTPEKEPIFVGTYLPKESRSGRLGMIDFIPLLHKNWLENREELAKNGSMILDAVLREKNSLGKEEHVIQEDDVRGAIAQIMQRYDRQFGGFGAAPKFPMAHQLLFLLRYGAVHKDGVVLEAISHTLSSMRRGGIFDQIGYGFHRYSTDEKWLLPHFEKMLYDQAQLAFLYLEAFEVFGENQFLATAKEIFTYVFRDLSHEGGGYFCAEDADSEGEEGKFYVWEENEIRHILGTDATWFFEKFGFRAYGNFRDEASRLFTGKNIPFQVSEINDFQRWNSIREVLFLARKKRIHPLKDDKILTDWNGLMLHALAKAYSVTGEEHYLEKAEKLIQFVRKNLFKSGRLLHRFREEQAGIAGTLDDYAFMIEGLLALYQATFENAHLTFALELFETTIKLFWDEENGGFFQTAHDAEVILYRKKEYNDGATPSGNGVMLSVLYQMEKITANPSYAGMIEKLLASPELLLKAYPASFTYHYLTLLKQNSPSFEIVIKGNLEDKKLSKMLRLIRKKYLPNKVMLHTGSNSLVVTAPYLKNYLENTQQPTIYICSNYECQQPVHEVESLRELLNSLS